MKYSRTITIEEPINQQEKISRIDEFLKEYWGYSQFEKEIKEHTSFFAALDTQDITALKENDYQLTPRTKEVFGFTISENQIEISFYNSDEGYQRERQFEKIATKFSEAIKQEVPPFRTFLSKYGSLEVMCHHRFKEGKIGFTFSPQPNSIDNRLFIYWEDFEILRASVIKGFDFSDINHIGFDDTSRNYIHKGACIYIINSLINKELKDFREKAFVDYITNWFEQQISENKGVCIIGNL